MARRLALAPLFAAALWAQNAGAVAPARTVPEDDEREIRRDFSQQAEAWNRHDGAAWAAGFADDADFTSSLGATTHGRDAIAALHATLFRGALAESVLRNEDIDVRFLGRDVAVVLTSAALSGVGFTTTFGPRNGRYRILAVLRRDSGRWTIEAMQCVRRGSP